MHAYTFCDPYADDKRVKKHFIRGRICKSHISFDYIISVLKEHLQINENNRVALQPSSIKGLSPTSLGIFWVSLPFLYVKTGVQIVKQIPSLIGIENVHETECHGRGRKNKQIKTPGSSLPINNLCFDRPYMHETSLYCYSPKDSKHHTCKSPSPPPLSLCHTLNTDSILKFSDELITSFVLYQRVQISIVSYQL